jgi:protein O-GlcNAc transferase
VSGAGQPTGLMGAALDHHRAGRLSDAERAYEAVLDADPANVDALNLLGVIKGQKGDLAAAERLIGAALRRAPNAPLVILNYGNVLNFMGRYAEAVAHFDQVLAAMPTNAQAWNNRGHALRALGCLEEALESFERLLRLAPDLADAWLAHGNILFALRRLPQALESYSRAVTLRPRFPEALTMQALVHAQRFESRQALAAVERALSFAPKLTSARFVQALAALPQAAVSEEEAAAAGALFAQRIDGLRTDCMDEAHGWINALPLFGLTYQERNNRDEFAKYGALCSDAMALWHRRHHAPARAARVAGSPGTPVRLGIASSFVWGHSVWHAILKGIVEHIDRAKVELHIFHLGRLEDAETAWARSRCASFSQGPQSEAASIDAIQARELDVLFYPEVCADHAAHKLASLRLADKQITTWGHPHTTGLPTMDCFFSADAFEPGDAQDHYTERLIRLPRLGCCLKRDAVEAGRIDLEALGIAGDGPILLSPGTPYKYAPQHDWVFPEIAHRMGAGTIVFFEHEQMGPIGRQLRARLDAAFRARGMRFEDHARLIPWQDKPAYHALMRRADLMLDTIGFSGFNTAMQAIECGLPIVAREGRFMRGRFGSGILRSLGLGELVAADEKAYVDLAVAVASDPERRRALQRQIEDRRAPLFDDVAAVRAFEDSILELAQRRG